MIHVEQKNILKKTGIRNPHKTAVQQKHNQREKISSIKNNENAVPCVFYYDFGRFFMDFREKQAKHGQLYCVKIDRLTTCLWAKTLKNRVN